MDKLQRYWVGDQGCDEADHDDDDIDLHCMAIDVAYLEAENAALREALKPFARFAEVWNHKPLGGSGRNPFYEIHVGTEWHGELNLRDCETAQRLINET